MNKWFKKFNEIFSFLGSIASVTGISLLWAKDSIKSISVDDIIFFLVVTVLFISFYSLLIISSIRIFKKYKEENNMFKNVSVILLLIISCVFLGVLLPLLFNKIIISVNFEWFFTN